MGEWLGLGGSGGPGGAAGWMGGPTGEVVRLGRAGLYRGCSGRVRALAVECNCEHPPGLGVIYRAGSGRVGPRLAGRRRRGLSRSGRARSLWGCPGGRRRGTGEPWTAGPYSYTRETGAGRTVVWPKREPQMGGIVLGGLERVARAAVPTGPDKNSPPFLRRKDWPLRQPTKTARPQTKSRPGSVVVR